MTFFELLINDHKEAKALLKDLLGRTREDIQPDLQKLIRELEVHMEIEEKHLYPECLKVKAVTDEGLIKDAKSEHQELKRHAAELKQGDLDPSECEQLLGELQKELNHHTRDEEEKLFPILKREWSEDKIQELTEKMSAEKEELLGSRK